MTVHLIFLAAISASSYSNLTSMNGDLRLAILTVLLSVLFTLTKNWSNLTVHQLALFIQFTFFSLIPGIYYLCFGFTSYIHDKEYAYILDAVPYCMTVSSIAYLISFFAVSLFPLKGLRSAQNDFSKKYETPPIPY